MAERKGKGNSRWAWWLLALVVIVVAVFLSYPLLMHLHTGNSGRERSAVSSVRSLCTANVSYQYSHPKEGYARSLKDLRQANVISPLLDSGQVLGYRYEYTAGSGPEGRIEEYHIIARPVRYGKDGKASYYSDENCVIHFTRDDRAATASDPPLQ